MPRSWLLLSAAVLVFCSGCMEAPVEHTVRKVVPEDVAGTTDKPVDSARQPAAQTKESFEVRLEAGLAEMDDEMERLREKGRALKDEAKARWNEKMAELEAKRKVAGEKLDELRKSTGEAWEHLEKGAQSAWDDVRKAFQDAAAEF
jgi:predicted  nucleic acid-binding Zn-ribbon protein